MDVKSWERSTILVMNAFDGWDLQWTDREDYYTAIGETPKGNQCALKIHFDLYEEPYINGGIYARLMNELPEDMVKLYLFVNKKANYLFWMNEIKTEAEQITIKLNKRDATITNIND